MYDANNAFNSKLSIIYIFSSEINLTVYYGISIICI
jgi:hypothetical protein